MDVSEKFVYKKSEEATLSYFWNSCFMVLVAIQVISQDSETGELYRQIANQRWGYDVKISELSEE